jgi:transposase
LYSKIKDFYYIWTTNKTKEWKNFTLVPLKRLGRHHVNYDTQAFYQLLAACKLVPKVYNPKTARDVNVHKDVFQHNVQWSDFLNLPKNKEYSGSFSTDGVTCCLHMSRTKRTEPTAVNSRQISPADTYIGIDPGLRLFLGGVRVEGGNPYAKANITNIKYKSSKYHHESGKASRSVKLKKWTKEQNEIEKTRPATQTWREYIVFALRHMNRLQSLFLPKKVTRLKFDAHIRRDKTIAKIIREEFIKDAPGRVVVFFGDAKAAPNSPMKGYIRSPHTKFIQQLKRHHQIHFVGIDEYNTTKVCSSCLSKAQHTISKSPHRFSSCKECKIVWNRDVNAGLNILYIGYQQKICDNKQYSIRCA